MLKILVTSLLFSTILFSHPHTFIDVYPTIQSKGKKVTHIHFKWIMDEMTSSMLIMEFDQNGDMKIDRNENHYIYKNYFTLLADSDFYTKIKLKDKLQIFPKPINFKASIQNNRICYSFEIKTDYNIDELMIDFGDPDFFIAMMLKKEFLKARGIVTKISEVDNGVYYAYRLELQKEHE